MSKLLNLVYLPRCPYCGKIIKANESCCELCKSKLSINKKCVKICKYDDLTVFCISPFEYSGLVKTAILNYKFHSKKVFANQFAIEMANSINENYSNINFDLITSVPLSLKRRINRGYNQAELLAKLIGKNINIPYFNTLKKIKNNLEQHKLSLEDRVKNVQGVYSYKNIDIIKGKNILLCDDIVTTGNTLKECCKILFEAGAKSVMCVTIARAV